MNLLILGCGEVGSVVARQIAAHSALSTLIIADINKDAANSLANEIGDKASARQVDVTSPSSLGEVFADADIVFNAVGPFYRFALPIIEAAINAKVNYIDINDDYDVSAALLDTPDYDRQAREAGVAVITSCGFTPGLSNIIARYGVDQMDRASSIRLCWTAPMLLELYSPATIGHGIHIVDGEHYQFLEGRRASVRGFTGERTTRFLPPFNSVLTSYSGHAEPVTLPHFIGDGLEEVSIRSAYLPKQGDDLIRHLAEFGFGQQAEVPGLGISPAGFISRYLTSGLGRKAVNIDTGDVPYGYALQVEVCGCHDGVAKRVIYELHGMMNKDQSRQSADPTPICARLFVEHFLTGAVTQKGVLAPEACFPPWPLIQDVIRAMNVKFYQRTEEISEPLKDGGGLDTDVGQWWLDETA